MDNKMKGGVATVAATALLAGGSTFMLWSQTQNVNGATITSGDLGVSVAAPSWFDISADRADATSATGLTGVTGHSIATIADQRVIPGDTVLGVFNIDGKLVGENMVAKLTVTDASGQALAGSAGTPVDGDGSTVDGGYTVEYALVDNTGAVVGNWAATTDAIKFASADNGNNVTALPTLGATLDGNADYKLAVRVKFDADGVNHAGAQQQLSGMKVGLAQVREQDGKGGYKS